MIFRLVYKSGQIFPPFCHNSRVWHTDGHTEFSSLDRVCIWCSAVKMNLGPSLDKQSFDMSSKGSGGTENSSQYQVQLFILGPW